MATLAFTMYTMTTFAPPLIYTLEIEVNIFDFNPKYPKEPKSLGEKLRKARIDEGMTLREAAALFGVSDTVVINWEIRGKMPDESRMEKVKEFVASYSATDFT